jgi:hypothetical protein
LAQFEAILKKRAVPLARHADYRKWLRYYLDFRSRYSLPDSRSEHVRLFIDKLRQKNQTPDQQKQLRMPFLSSLNLNHKRTSSLRVRPNRMVGQCQSRLNHINRHHRPPGRQFACRQFRQYISAVCLSFICRQSI